MFKASVSSRDRHRSDEQDVGLMSYVWSAAVGNHTDALRRAFAALRRGGFVLVHDFMVYDRHEGPGFAGLVPARSNAATTSMLPHQSTPLSLTLSVPLHLVPRCSASQRPATAQESEERSHGDDRTD